MDLEEATWRAIAALKNAQDNLAEKVLEDSIKITGNCQYCDKKLVTSIETFTLLDTCEECYLIEGMHPGQVKTRLKKMVLAYGLELKNELSI